MKITSIGPSYLRLLSLLIKREEAAKCNDDEWTAAGATTFKEAIKLAEAGFQYVTTIEGTQLLQKKQITTANTYLFITAPTENEIPE